MLEVVSFKGNQLPGGANGGGVNTRGQDNKPPWDMV